MNSNYVKFMIEIFKSDDLKELSVIELNLLTNFHYSNEKETDIYLSLLDFAKLKKCELRSNSN